MSMTHDTEWITPEIANRLLDRNTHNRPLNQGDILKWATEMEAGNWKLNGEAIKICADGAILDGQHRLHAVALQSDDVAIPFLVVRGLPRDTQRTMDQGRKRSAADQLNLEHIDASGVLTSAVRFHMITQRGLLFRDSKVQAAEVTTPAIVRWAMENPDDVEILRRGCGFKRIKARAAVVATAHYLIVQQHGIDCADEFMARLEDGVGLEQGSPILALRYRLDQIRGERGRPERATRVSDRDLLGMFIVTFNYWLTGKFVSKVQRPNGGSWNEQNYPQVFTPRQLKMSITSKRSRANA